ncbi:MAG: LuxR C-terminal-related transcriptional regulator [Acidobacteriota bacterium]
MGSHSGSAHGWETLDRIARSDQAVFATDCAERIILWNKKCEALLGRPARSVLGRRCYEVTGGLDVQGNLYCHQSCPVAFQAREKKQQPVRSFPLSVEVPGKGHRRFEVSMFAVPSYHPALAAVVHVLREGRVESALERELSRETPARDPLWPMTTNRGEPVYLTDREREILKCLAEGMGTPSIARRLLIAPVTVRNHTAKILQKLDVHTKLAAVVFAYQQRLLTPPDQFESTPSAERQPS